MEGLRLNAGQTTLGLCPIVFDQDDPNNPKIIRYPEKRFTLGSPHYLVEGTTKASAQIPLEPGESQTRRITTLASAHPALGVLVRSGRDKNEVSLVPLP